MRKFSTGATRDTTDGKPDYRGFFSPLVLKRRAEYMQEHQKQADGKLRASDNWKKGIPQKEYLSSLLRHTVDVWRELDRGIPAGGCDVTENLLCAILFNAEGLLHERLLGRDVGKETVEVPPSPVMTFEQWQGEYAPSHRRDCRSCHSLYQQHFDGLRGDTK